MRRILAALAAGLMVIAACGGGKNQTVGAAATSTQTSPTSTSVPVPAVTHYPLDNMPVIGGPWGEAALTGFGGGGMLIDRLHVPANTDLTPYLPNGWCDVPHWGYVLEGAVHVRYRDGSEEVFPANHAYYMRSGHTVWFTEPTTMIEFSPEKEMRDLAAHVNNAIEQVLSSTTTTISSP